MENIRGEGGTAVWGWAERWAHEGAGAVLFSGTTQSIDMEPPTVRWLLVFRCRANAPYSGGDSVATLLVGSSSGCIDGGMPRQRQVNHGRGVLCETMGRLHETGGKTSNERQNKVGPQSWGSQRDVHLTVPREVHPTKVAHAVICVGKLPAVRANFTSLIPGPIVGMV